MEQRLFGDIGCKHTLIGVLALLALVLAAMVGCSSKEKVPVPDPGPPSPSNGLSERLEPAVLLASSDLSVGFNRFGFGVLDSKSVPVRIPSATATFVFLGNESQEVRGQADADFVEWPNGRAGIYVTNIAFDEAGRWGLIVNVIDGEGSTIVANTSFDVAMTSTSPAIGEPVPKTANKTIRDSSDIGEITSAREPDLGLYSMTISEAVASGMPTVVTFATPAFCQTATCGPQVEVVSALKRRYEARANFIHVEVFDNPKEMSGNFNAGRISPMMKEWGLDTEPWTFVLDYEGMVALKFEGFVTDEELEVALKTILDS